jgi:V/A-type H+-transporting ATPase subunit A
MSDPDPVGEVIGISGPVITSKVDESVKDLMMNEIVFVGEQKLIGEISNIRDDAITIQVYEDPVGLQRGSPVYRSNELLSVELGPGLLGSIYDGLQRPLEIIAREMGPFIRPAARAARLSKDAEWEFRPRARVGKTVEAGDILGIVHENEVIDHKIMVPPNVGGRLVKLAEGGRYKVNEVIAVVKGEHETSDLKLLQTWPVKKPRPYIRKLTPVEPLITGQRVLDFFLPVAKGGTVAVAGGFGTGKTVLQHQLAKFLNTDIIIYVGCGERGNEIADLLQRFPKLKDAKTGLPLLRRTIIIANTSNMPVAAREASVYTGVTMAEYYRDMGYDVALLVDSTSRWAEALREVSARQGEMPGEEGYPAYLASRIAEFYGRAGKTYCLGSEKRVGSVSIIASVSPSGGDFSEPVTQKTLQIVRAFWALDPDLAYRRHFPAANLQQSFSFYVDAVEPFWYEKVHEGWRDVRERALKLYTEKLELERVVRLVGTGALSEKEKIAMKNGELLEEVFLKQNAFHPVDSFCSPAKQFQLLDLVMLFHRSCEEAIKKGVPSGPLIRSPIRGELEKMKELPQEKVDEAYWSMRARIRASLSRLLRTYG